MIERIARWTHEHRWLTLVIWIVALFTFLILGNTIKGPYQRNFSLPGAESQQAFDLLKARFPAHAGGTVDIVFKADDGVTSPGIRNRMDNVFSQIGTMPHIDAVVSPYSTQGARQISPDGKIAFAEVEFGVQAIDVPKAEANQLIDLARSVESPGLQVEFAGDVILFTQQQQPGSAEAVGLVAAILILLITFGSLLAMVLPLMSALFGIAIGLSLVLIFANIISVPEFTPQIAAMIGIGVGVDYALFIVTRYRQGLHDDLDPEAATLKAMVTAGRAVVFAGTVVVISLLGILLMGFQFVQGIAVGGAAAVFVTMLASITLLPAMLGFVGGNIDKLKVPFFRTSRAAGQAGFWYRWSRFIQRRPWVAGLTGLGLVILLAIPFFSMRLGSADSGNDPKSLTTRRSYDLLSEGFGPGFNGPLILAAKIDSPDALAALNKLDEALRTTPGIAEATPVVPNQKGDAAIITVYPTTSPQDAATSDLVHRLRAHIIPGVIDGSDMKVYVGGLTAIFVDFAGKIAERLPILIAVVIALSFLLLMAVFRSVLVPLKAAIMNLLSIGASYGVIVAVFQWGWARQVVGVDKTGPIESWIPMMMFTILFGLSMDYEIFLLSRVREEYMRTRDNAASVADGVAKTGRVITAAAAIMIVVFLTFVVGFDIRQVKEIGLGLAVAVLVDVTLVRMVLVPATMELLGDANWWLPKWLERAIPRFSIDREFQDLLDSERVSAP
ncbi:MAG: MMPL family transporter [Actinomycetota bacterium]